MLETLSLFALVFTASAITPGPDTMTIFGRSLSGGRFAAVPFTVGVVLAKLTLMTLVVLGLAALAQSFGGFFTVLKFAGAAYLVWSGIRTWRASREAEAHSLAPKVSWRDSLTGYALGISNPQAVAFYVALLPTVMNVQALDLTTYLSLCVVLTGVMSLVVVVYALSADRLRYLLRSPRARKVTSRVAGGVMISSGVLVATR